MNIPQIQIRTTDAVLGLTIDQPTQIIRQPKADLQISQPAAVLEITSTPAKLLIDTTQARADLGKVSTLEASRQNALSGREIAMQGIARRAQEGEQLMRIENKGNPIPGMAKENAYPAPKELGITFVPSANAVKLSYEKGSLDIQVTPQKPLIDVKINAPIHEYTPGKVSRNMLQYPSIQMDVIR